MCKAFYTQNGIGSSQVRAVVLQKKIAIKVKQTIL
jgi:hypothetical protein